MGTQEMIEERDKLVSEIAYLKKVIYETEKQIEEIDGNAE